MSPELSIVDPDPDAGLSASGLVSIAARFSAARSTAGPVFIGLSASVFASSADSVDTDMPSTDVVEGDKMAAISDLWESAGSVKSGNVSSAAGGGGGAGASGESERTHVRTQVKNFDTYENIHVLGHISRNLTSIGTGVRCGNIYFSRVGEGRSRHGYVVRWCRRRQDGRNIRFVRS